MANNFFKTTVLTFAAIATLASCGSNQSAQQEQLPSKKERIQQLLSQAGSGDYVPAAFFKHFPHKFGPEAVQEHVDFIRATGNDVAKVQFEVIFPAVEINKPEDLANVPVYEADFFEEQLAVIEGVSKQLGDSLLILPTVYGPTIMLYETLGKNTIELIKANPELGEKAIDNVTTSLENFLRAARQRGADGFYVSSILGVTEEGEIDYDFFNNYIRKYDKRLSETAHELSSINVLHICGFTHNNFDYAQYADYPGEIINIPSRHADGSLIDLKALQEIFQRPIFGGLDNRGVIVNGSIEEIKAEIDKVFAVAPASFVLGADCTVPADQDLSKLRAAIDYAHGWRAAHAQ